MSTKITTTPLTKEHFDDEMDRRFGIQSKEIDRRFGIQSKEIDRRFDLQYKYIDKRLNKQDKTISKRFIAMQESIDFSLEPIMQEQEINKKFRFEVMKTLDWLVGAFKRFDEEHSILAGNYSNVTDQLDDHGQRIDKLEQASAIP